MKDKVKANNAHVKSGQAKMKARMGDKPKCPKEMKKFDAYMCNDGESAKGFARKLTKGLDKDAFPLK